MSKNIVDLTPPISGRALVETIPIVPTRREMSNAKDEAMREQAFSKKLLFDDKSAEAVVTGKTMLNQPNINRDIPKTDNTRTKAIPQPKSKTKDIPGATKFDYVGQSKKDAEAKEMDIGYGDDKLDEARKIANTPMANQENGEIFYDIPKIQSARLALQGKIDELTASSGLTDSGKSQMFTQGAKDNGIIGKAMLPFVPIADTFENLQQNYLHPKREGAAPLTPDDPKYAQRKTEYQLEEYSKIMNNLTTQYNYAKTFPNGKVDFSPQRRVDEGVSSAAKSVVMGYVGDFANHFTDGGATKLMEKVFSTDVATGRALLQQELEKAKRLGGNKPDEIIPELGMTYNQFVTGWESVLTNTGLGIVNLVSSLAPGGSFSTAGAVANDVISIASKVVKSGANVVKEKLALRTATALATDKVVFDGIAKDIALKAVDPQWVQKTELFSPTIKNMIAKAPTDAARLEVVEFALKDQTYKVFKQVFAEAKLVGRALEQANMLKSAVGRVNGLGSLDQLSNILADIVSGTTATQSEVLGKIAVDSIRMYLTGLLNTGDAGSAENLATLGAYSSFFGTTMKKLSMTYLAKSDALRQAIAHGDSKLTNDLIAQYQKTSQLFAIIANDFGGGGAQTVDELRKLVGSEDIWKEIVKTAMPNFILAHGSFTSANRYMKERGQDVQNKKWGLEFNNVVAKGAPNVSDGFGGTAASIAAGKDIRGTVESTVNKAYHATAPGKQKVSMEKFIKDSANLSGISKNTGEMKVGELLNLLERWKKEGLLSKDFKVFDEANHVKILSGIPADTKVVFTQENKSNTESKAEYDATTNTINFHNFDFTGTAQNPIRPEEVFSTIAGLMSEELTHAATVHKIKANPEKIDALRQKYLDKFNAMYPPEVGLPADAGAIQYALSNNEEFVANLFNNLQSPHFFKFIKEADKAQNGTVKAFLDNVLDKFGLDGADQTLRKNISKIILDVLPEDSKELYTKPPPATKFTEEEIGEYASTLEPPTVYSGTDLITVANETAAKFNEQGSSVTPDEILPQSLLEALQVQHKIKEDQANTSGVYPGFFKESKDGTETLAFNEEVERWNSIHPIKITNAQAYHIVQSILGEQKFTPEIGIQVLKEMLNESRTEQASTVRQLIEEVESEAIQAERDFIEGKGKDDKSDLRAYKVLGYEKASELYAEHSAGANPTKTPAQVTADAYKAIMEGMNKQLKEQYGDKEIPTKELEKAEIIAKKESIKLSNSGMVTALDGERIPFSLMKGYHRALDGVRKQIGGGLTYDNKRILDAVLDIFAGLKPINKYNVGDGIQTGRYYRPAGVTDMAIVLDEKTPAQIRVMTQKLHQVIINHAVTSEAFYRGSKHDPAKVAKAARELMPFVNYKAVAEGKSNFNDLFVAKLTSKHYGKEYGDTDARLKKLQTEHSDVLQEVIDNLSSLYDNKGYNPHEGKDGPLTPDEATAFQNGLHGIMNLTLNPGGNDMIAKRITIDENGVIFRDPGKISAKYIKLVIDNNTFRMTDVANIGLYNPLLIKDGKVDAEYLAAEYPDLALLPDGNLAFKLINTEQFLPYLSPELKDWLSSVAGKDTQRIDGGIIAIGEMPGVKLLATAVGGGKNSAFFKGKGTGLFKNAIHNVAPSEVVHPDTPGYNSIKSFAEKITKAGIQIHDGTSLKNTAELYEYHRMPLPNMEGNLTALLDNSGTIVSILDNKGSNVTADAKEKVLKALAYELETTGKLPDQMITKQPITGEHALTLMTADKEGKHNAGGVVHPGIINLVPTGRLGFDVKPDVIAKYTQAISDLTENNFKHFSKQLDGVASIERMLVELSQGEHITGTKAELGALQNTVEGLEAMLNENPDILYRGVPGTKLLAEIDGLFKTDDLGKRLVLDKDQVESFLIDRFKLFTGKSTDISSPSSKKENWVTTDSILFDLAKRSYDSIQKLHAVNGSNSMSVSPNFGDSRFAIERLVGKGGMADELTKMFIDPKNGNIINMGIALPLKFIKDNNLQPGQSILVSRIPAHDTGSTTVMTLIGATDSHSTIHADSEYLTGSAGMDFDKDSLQILLPDPHILTKDIYKAMIDYIGDVTKDTSKLYPDIMKIDSTGELDRIYKELGLSHLLKDVSHSPLSRDAYNKGDNGTALAGAAVSLKKSIALIAAAYAATGEVKGDYRYVTAKRGDIKLVLKFPLKPDMMTAIANAAAQLGYDNFAGHHIKEEANILMPYLHSITFGEGKTHTGKDLGDEMVMRKIGSTVRELAHNVKMENAQGVDEPTHQFGTQGNNAARALVEHNMIQYGKRLKQLDETLKFLNMDRQIQTIINSNSIAIGKKLQLFNLMWHKNADSPELLGTLNYLRDAISTQFNSLGRKGEWKTGGVTKSVSSLLYYNDAFKHLPAAMMVSGARQLANGTEIRFGENIAIITSAKEVKLNGETVPFEQFLVKYGKEGTRKDAEALHILYYDQNINGKGKGGITYNRMQTTIDGLIAVVGRKVKNIDDYANLGDLRVGDDPNDVTLNTIKEIATRVFFGSDTPLIDNKQNFSLHNENGSGAEASRRALERAGIVPKVHGVSVADMARDEFKKTLATKEQPNDVHGAFAFGRASDQGSNIFDNPKTTYDELRKALVNHPEIANKPVTKWTAEDFRIAKPIIMAHAANKVRALKGTIMPSLWKQFFALASPKGSEIGKPWDSDPEHKHTQHVIDEIGELLDYDYLRNIESQETLKNGKALAQLQTLQMLPHAVQKLNDMMKAQGYNEVNNYTGTLDLNSQLTYSSYNQTFSDLDQDIGFTKTYGPNGFTESRVRAFSMNLNRRLGINLDKVHTTVQYKQFLHDAKNMSLIKDQINMFLGNYNNADKGYDVNQTLPVLSKILKSPTLKAMFDAVITPDYSVSTTNILAQGKLGGVHIDYNLPDAVQARKENVLKGLSKEIFNAFKKQQVNLVDGFDMEETQAAMNLGEITLADIKDALSMYTDQVLLNNTLSVGLDVISDSITNLINKNSQYADVASYTVIQEQLKATIESLRNPSDMAKWHTTQAVSTDMLNNTQTLIAEIGASSSAEIYEALVKTGKIPFKPDHEFEDEMGAKDDALKGLQQFLSGSKTNFKVNKRFNDGLVPDKERMEFSKEDVKNLMEALPLDRIKTVSTETQSMMDAETEMDALRAEEEARYAESMGIAVEAKTPQPTEALKPARTYIDTTAEVMYDAKSYKENLINHLQKTLLNVNTVSKNIFNDNYNESEFARAITNTLFSEYAGKEFTDDYVIKSTKTPDGLTRMFDDPDKEIPKGQYVEFLHADNNGIDSQHARYLGIVKRNVAIKDIEGNVTNVPKNLIVLLVDNGSRASISLVEEKDIKTMTAQMKVSRSGQKQEKVIKEFFDKNSNQLMEDIRTYVDTAAWEEGSKGRYKEVNLGHSAQPTTLFSQGTPLINMSRTSKDAEKTLLTTLNKYSTTIAYSLFGRGTQTATVGLALIGVSALTSLTPALGIGMIAAGAAQIGKRGFKLFVDGQVGSTGAAIQHDVFAKDFITQATNMFNHLWSPKTLNETTAIRAVTQVAIAAAIEEAGVEKDISKVDSFYLAQQAREEIKAYNRIENFIGDGLGSKVNDEGIAKLKEEYALKGMDVNFTKIGKDGYALKINDHSYQDMQKANKTYLDLMLNALHATGFQAKLEATSTEKAMAIATQVNRARQTKFKEIFGTDVSYSEAEVLNYIDYSTKTALGSFVKSAKQATPFGRFITQFQRYQREAAVDQYNLFKYRNELYTAVEDDILYWSAKAGAGDRKSQQLLDILEQVGLVSATDMTGSMSKLKNRAYALNTAAGLLSGGGKYLGVMALNQFNQILNGDDDDEEKGTGQLIGSAIGKEWLTERDQDMRPYSGIYQGGATGLTMATVLAGVYGMFKTAVDVKTDEDIDLRRHTKNLKLVEGLTAPLKYGLGMTAITALNTSLVAFYASILNHVDKGKGFTEKERTNPNYYLNFVMNKIAQASQMFPFAALATTYVNEQLKVNKTIKNNDSFFKKATTGNPLPMNEKEGSEGSEGEIEVIR